METKICSTCKKYKNITEFNKCTKHKDGLRYNCKECHKKYLQENKEKIKIKQKEYQEKNYEKLKKIWANYSLKNKEEIKLKRINRYYENPKKDLIINKNYRQKTKLKRNNDLKERRKNDIEFNICCKIRSRIRTAIKKGYKSSKSLLLLGCDLLFFRKYIEKKFKKGMSWDKILNGEIHLDHIIPCNSFDLTIEENQKICFNYTNYQPLWAKDNLSKQDKIIECQLTLIL